MPFLRWISVPATIALLVAALGPLGAEPGGGAGSRAGRRGAGAATGDALAGVPLTFVQNRGQVARSVDFYVEGGDTAVSFGEEGVAFSLADPVGPRRWGMALDFVDARPVEPRSGERASGVVSYFRGSPHEWVTGVPTYRSLGYPELWPGIDLAYSGAPGALKYEFRVEPGADLDAIRLLPPRAPG